MNEWFRGVLKDITEVAEDNIFNCDLIDAIIGVMPQWIWWVLCLGFLWFTVRSNSGKKIMASMGTILLIAWIPMVAKLWFTPQFIVLSFSALLIEGAKIMGTVGAAIAIASGLKARAGKVQGAVDEQAKAVEEVRGVEAEGPITAAEIWMLIAWVAGAIVVMSVIFGDDMVVERQKIMKAGKEVFHSIILPAKNQDVHWMMEIVRWIILILGNGAGLYWVVRDIKDGWWRCPNCSHFHLDFGRNKPECKACGHYNPHVFWKCGSCGTPNLGEAYVCMNPACNRDRPLSTGQKRDLLRDDPGKYSEQAGKAGSTASRL